MPVIAAKVNKTTLKAMVKAYNGGSTIKQVSELYAMSYGTARKLLVEGGATIRAASRRKKII